MMLLGVLSTLYTTAETGRLYENNEDDNAITRRFKGVVLDENGTPLPGASIVVIGTTIGAGTNTQGEFTLSLRDKGFPILRASFIGYTPVEYKIQDNEHNNIVIRLKPTQSSLEEVVVTGTRTEKPLKDVPVLTRVIGQKEIQALNPMDIETLLQYELPGIQFNYNSMSKLPEITYWLMGSFTSATYQKLLIGSPLIIVGIVIIYLLRWRLNILALSEDEAKASGIDLKKTRMIFILASTLITASAVSMCGQIGWIGLLIPHCARMLVGSNNRYVVPLSISLGASFMILIDTLSRSLTVIELPLSILTAIIGAPVFILLLNRSKLR